MQELLGWLAIAAFWSQYPGFLDQIRKTWQEANKEKRQSGAVRANRSLSVQRNGLDLVKYGCWIVYATALTPVNWVIILARIPVFFFLPVILYQARNPAFSSKDLFKILGGCLAGCVLAGFGLWALQGYLQIWQQSLGWIVTSVFILGLAIGIPDQMKRLWEKGNQEVSARLQSLILFNFLAQLVYGIAIQNWVLILCYSLGCLGQLLLLGLMAYNSQRRKRSI